ncbi:MAG: hypothetical protein V3T70_06290 [Phycisphaerae bacterium]
MIRSSSFQAASDSVFYGTMQAGVHGGGVCALFPAGKRADQTMAMG